MKKLISLYLCGPMTGFSKHNAYLFRKYSKLLRKKGYAVISPIELDGGRINLKWEECIKRDLKMMERESNRS